MNEIKVIESILDMRVTPLFIVSPMLLLVIVLFNEPVYYKIIILVACANQ
jgi:hypothetical protein